MVEEEKQSDRQQQLGTASMAAEASPESVKKGAKKPESGKKAAAKSAAQPNSKLLISFSEYRVATERDISTVLEQGFRVWMKTDKNEPLRSRTVSEWDKLITEYLKS